MPGKAVLRGKRIESSMLGGDEDQKRPEGKSQCTPGKEKTIAIKAGKRKARRQRKKKGSRCANEKGKMCHIRSAAKESKSLKGLCS